MEVNTVLEQAMVQNATFLHGKDGPDPHWRSIVTILVMSGQVSRVAEKKINKARETGRTS